VFVKAVHGGNSSTSSLLGFFDYQTYWLFFRSYFIIVNQRPSPAVERICGGGAFSCTYLIVVDLQMLITI